MAGGFFHARLVGSSKIAEQDIAYASVCFFRIRNYQIYVIALFPFEKVSWEF